MPTHSDPERPADDDTGEWPVPIEDRWYEDDADPSPSLMRGMVPYPTEPAEADEGQGPPSVSPFVPALLLVVASIALLAMLVAHVREGR